MKKLTLCMSNKILSDLIQFKTLKQALVAKEALSHISSFRVALVEENKPPNSNSQSHNRAYSLLDFVYPV